MRVIFAGRDNSFNRGIVHWLKRDHEVVACLFLEPDRFGFKARWRRIRGRARRYGWFKAMDELAFHLADRLFVRRGEKELFEGYFPEEFLRPAPLEVPEYSVRKIHSQEWLDFIQQQKPDILFSVCGTVIFRPKLFNIPRLGTYVLHEGLTPEYKGLHTPLWGLMQQEPEFLGYTLLKVDESIDGGKVLIQGGYDPPEGCGVRQWSFIAHHAIVQGLDDMAEAMRELERDDGFEPLDLKSRMDSGHTYTWMGLTDFVRLGLRKKKSHG